MQIYHIRRTMTLKSSRLIILWVVFLTLDTLAQIIFKIGGSSLENVHDFASFANTAITSPMVWIAIICYISMFFLWMLILQKMEVSQAFPLTGLTYITVPFCAYLLLNETIPWERGIGIGVILIGVILLGSES
jgi:drug/metabolite transporter (DMT)-like permease